MATVASKLRTVESLEALVLVDNVTDSLSTVPPGVANEQARLLQAGMTEMSGEAKCCAHHGLSLVLGARAGGFPRADRMEADEGSSQHPWRRPGLPLARLCVGFHEYGGRCDAGGWGGGGL